MDKDVYSLKESIEDADKDKMIADILKQRKAVGTEVRAPIDDQKLTNSNMIMN